MKLPVCCLGFENLKHHLEFNTEAKPRGKEEEDVEEEEDGEEEEEEERHYHKPKKEMSLLEEQNQCPERLLFPVTWSKSS